VIELAALIAIALFLLGVNLHSALVDHGRVVRVLNDFADQTDGTDSSGTGS
jgi:hypothetical protein